MPAAVEYLQVAFSLVANEMAVWVVPAASVPEGRALERIGATVSLQLCVVALALDVCADTFPAAS